MWVPCYFISDGNRAKRKLGTICFGVTFFSFIIFLESSMLFNSFISCLSALACPLFSVHTHTHTRKPSNLFDLNLKIKFSRLTQKKTITFALLPDNKCYDYINGHSLWLRKWISSFRWWRRCFLKCNVLLIWWRKREALCIQWIYCDYCWVIVVSIFTNRKLEQVWAGKIIEMLKGRRHQKKNHLQKKVARRQIKKNISWLFLSLL